MELGSHAGFEFLIKKLLKCSFPLVRILVSLHVLEINNRKRSLCSSANDEDDFLEVGSPVMPGVVEMLKLVDAKA